MAQKQFLFWSLASCTEGLNRNWNNSFISCSHPPVLSCATVASRMGKASFVDWTWHALSGCTQGMNTLTQFTATAVTYYFKKQLTKPEEILLLPQCTTFGKWPQHVSSRDSLSLGLRHTPAKGAGPQRARALLALERGVSSIPSGSGVGICCDSLGLGDDLCRKPLCNSEVRDWKTVSIDILQGTNIWLLLTSQPVNRWTACHL